MSTEGGADPGAIVEAFDQLKQSGWRGWRGWRPREAVSCGSFRVTTARTSSGPRGGARRRLGGRGADVQFLYYPVPGSRTGGGKLGLRNLNWD